MGVCFLVVNRAIMNYAVYLRFSKWFNDYGLSSFYGFKEDQEFTTAASRWRNIFKKPL